jgi:tRNA dimethylallyltransferase
VEPSPELRAELEAMSVEALAERLAAVDPRAMATIDLRNSRRLVRAIEVTLASGVPFSAQQELGSPRVRALLLGISWPADELRRRVEERVDARLNNTPSMVDEVRGLIADGVPPDRLQELGLEYRFITRHLLGELELATMRRQLVTAIYQFSRRQLTWFRRDQRIVWLDAGRDLADQAQRYAEEWLHDTYNRAGANG